MPGRGDARRLAGLRPAGAADHGHRVLVSHRHPGVHLSRLSRRHGIAREAPSRARCRRVEQTPTVDVLLVVHDAAELLAAKVANLLALDYPADRLRINIACDGCTDATETVARELASMRVRVFAFAERRGKSACIGHVLSAAGFGHRAVHRRTPDRRPRCCTRPGGRTLGDGCRRGQRGAGARCLQRLRRRHQRVLALRER